jgi:hypothetical protein
MNPDLDPRKFGEIVSQANNKPDVKKDDTPFTIPAIIRKNMAEGEFWKDHPMVSYIISYYVVPSLTSGVHKVATAFLDFFILDRPLRPSNQKNGNVYIYNDSPNRTNYAGYSQPQFSASYVGADGKARPITSDKYRKPSRAGYVRIPGERPWTEPEIEGMWESVEDRLVECIKRSGWFSVQDFYDACGQAGAPTTATRYGWQSVAGFGIMLDPEDPRIMIVRMSSDPEEIK